MYRVFFVVVLLLIIYNLGDLFQNYFIDGSDSSININSSTQNISNEFSDTQISRVLYSIATTPSPVIKKKVRITNNLAKTNSSSSELLNEVNLWRNNHNLLSINENSDICTMANIRINALVAAGNLDNHEGFSNYLSTHPLSSLKLNGISENLAIGPNSPDEIVKLWENSPPHRDQLLANKSMVKGCAVIKNNIAVLIGGY